MIREAYMLAVINLKRPSDRKPTKKTRPPKC